MTKFKKVILPLDDEPFFKAMSLPVLAKIETYVYHRSYEARQVVYFPDDPCDYVYWVREGRIRVTRVSGDGRELTFRHLGRGDMLGDECMADRPKRNDYAEALEPSTLCLMRTDDFRRAAREEAELALLGSGVLNKTDVLKVPHHGSKYSSTISFLEKLRPMVAVVSVGAKNSYGHPNGDTLMRLDMAGAEIFRTDQMGSVEIRSDGKAMSRSPNRMGRTHGRFRPSGLR
ncbi:MAG: cyclic nucleotide-binding domain-containing protein [Geobacteraceae bacterium]|nr:cyclic nucleotide-binding domain-containing protein [Geobacteraceae bacterium]